MGAVQDIALRVQDGLPNVGSSRVRAAAKRLCVVSCFIAKLNRKLVKRGAMEPRRSMLSFTRKPPSGNLSRRPWLLPMIGGTSALRRGCPSQAPPVAHTNTENCCRMRTFPLMRRIWTNLWCPQRPMAAWGGWIIGLTCKKRSPLWAPFCCAWRFNIAVADACLIHRISRPWRCGRECGVCR